MTTSTSSTKKPRYKAIDFPELLANMSQEEKDAYTHADAKRTRMSALNALHLMRGNGKDVQVTCPECGSRRCFMLRGNGIWRCWVCSASGILDELRDIDHREGCSVDSHYYANASKRRNREGNDYVPMLPSDYEEIAPETRSWLYPIYPFDDTEERTRFVEHFHSQQLAAKHPKMRGMMSAEQIRSLQGRVRHYCEAMHFDTTVLKREGVMCAMMFIHNDDQRQEDPQGVREVPCIAYCNRIFGRIVNVKLRSVEQNPITDQWSKDFTQVSPTKPCAPYGIDSICPTRPNAQPIDRLIITEGEKDRLTLLSCGFPYVLSIANGAETEVEKSHEAFEEWIAQAEEIVICGDTDRAGRKLVNRLLHHYGERALVVELPQGWKDISDYYAQFGAEEVRRAVLGAREIASGDVYHANDHLDNIMQVMLGNYDHGYDVGMGSRTDGILHLTSEGGLIIVTGIPNSGKTDFLNCLMTHLMAQRQKKVAFLSFELPNKEKHFMRIASTALGVEHVDEVVRLPDGSIDEGRQRSILLPAIQYLDQHMVDFDMKQRLPTPEYIIAQAERERRKRGLDFLVIDPYMYIAINDGNKAATETELVKEMLTKVQAWSREKHVWTVIVAHPRIQHKDGTQDFAPLDIYAASGSAHWANLADFFFSVKRINDPDAGRMFTVVDMLKVRDQEFCKPGKVWYVRQACGRYEERSSEEECVSENRGGAVCQMDTDPWI